MSLNNVYRWNKDGWQKITAEEFVKDNPNIKISAKDEYFWCEMCGQYVTLANGKQRTYFKHSSTEFEKDCEDRAKNFEKSDWIKSSQPSYGLPIKICVEQNDFYFKIGLPRIPRQIFDEIKNCRAKIQSAGKILNRCDLSDCLIDGATTWLDVGSSPEKSYSLTLEPKVSLINFYWSDEIDGINSRGTLFDAGTGRKILSDADIKVSSKYYLLTTNQHICSSKFIKVEFLACKHIFRDRWSLYEVEATELSKEAAKFFLHFHCRLTAKPVSISPIYPVFTQDDDVIHCNSKKIFVYFSGNAKVRFFPQIGNSILFEEQNSKFIEVACDEQQKIVAAGRSQILQYLHFWKGLPTFEIKFPQVEVKDCSGKIISGGTYHSLPKKLTLQIYADFDGQVIVSENHVVKRKSFLKAGEISNVDDIKFSMEIKIFQGLDCVWKIIYQREEKGIVQSDTELFLKLERGVGKTIKVPHTWGSFVDKLKDYPKVKAWLYKSIRTGFVNEESYFLFRQFILKAV